MEEIANYVPQMYAVVRDILGINPAGRGNRAGTHYKGGLQFTLFRNCDRWTVLVQLQI